MSGAGAAGVREICFDTESTGFDPARGDRMVEIGCVEIIDLMPTGKTLHIYLDPERDVPDEAVKVHGLTRAKLREHRARKFPQAAGEILEFFGGSRLVAHKAMFDMRFMNAELALAGRPPLTNPVADTLKIAKQAFGTASASLDALCKRFGISLDGRSYHGALIDAQLLARVYLELNGGRDRKLDLEAEPDLAAATGAATASLAFRPSRGIGRPGVEELARHAAFIGGMKAAIWTKAGEAAERPPSPRMG